MSPDQCIAQSGHVRAGGLSASSPLVATIILLLSFMRCFLAMPGSRAPFQEGVPMVKTFDVATRRFRRSGEGFDIKASSFIATQWVVRQPAGMTRGARG